jgi:hypothetical protein
MDIPVSLRRWFLAHTVVDLVVGLPLLILPAKFLGALHWPVVDVVTPRIVGAALLAIAIQSFTARNDGVEAYRTMLNFKLLWSWSAIAALVIAAADGAPDAVWAFLAIFIAFSGVWFHYRVRIGQMDHADEDAQDLDSEHGEMAAILNDPKLTPGSGHSAEVAKVAPARAPSPTAADAEREAAEMAAKAAAELAAWEASDADGEALGASATKTLQGRPRTREELDDELTGAAGELSGSEQAEADRLAADDIAAMLAANRGDDEPAAPAPVAPDEDAAGADDIAAMLAANQSSDGGDVAESAVAPAKADEEDAAGADDIAAMLAANQSSDEPAPAAAASEEDAAGADDIAAMLAANQSGDGGDVAETAGEAAAAASVGPSGPDEGSADDIAAMLAASQSEAEAEAEATPVAIDVEISEEEITRPGIEAADFAHLQALADNPAASPPAPSAEARAAADLAVPAPEDVTSDDVAGDDIAAMLAANRASEG